MCIYTLKKQKLKKFLKGVRDSTERGENTKKNFFFVFFSIFLKQFLHGHKERCKWKMILYSTCM